MRDILDRILAWWFHPNDGIVVKSMLVIDDTRGIFQSIPWNETLCSGSGWEEHARRCIDRDTSDDMRVEIRIVDKMTKRRIVLYPGDMCDPTFPKTTKAPLIVAQLIGKTCKNMNVTGRVQKYEYHKLKCPTHMFPFEDDEELRLNYSHIHVFDLFFKSENLPL